MTRTQRERHLMNRPAADMRPWQPMKNVRDSKTIGKLGEECGKLSAAISRCQVQGIDGKEPVTGKVNREWLEEEIADVEANILLVKERFKLDADFIKARSARKVKHLRTWHAML